MPNRPCKKINKPKKNLGSRFLTTKQNKNGSLEIDFSSKAIKLIAKKKGVSPKDVTEEDLKQFLKTLADKGEKKQIEERSGIIIP